MSCTPNRPCGTAQSRKRSGAAEASLAALSGRSRKAKAPLPPAATCRRRTARASALALQPSTTRGAALASACSMAHRASLAARLPAAGVTTARRVKSIPAAAQAGAWGGCGGATSKLQPPSWEFPQTVRKAGNSSETSPRPTPSTSTSVSAPHGQPPPGNSASSAAKPDGRVSRQLSGKPLPRQISGRARTSANALNRFTPVCRCGSDRPRCPRWRRCRSDHSPRYWDNRGFRPPTRCVRLCVSGASP